MPSPFTTQILPGHSAFSSQQVKIGRLTAEDEANQTFSAECRTSLSDPQRHAAYVERSKSDAARKIKLIVPDLQNFQQEALSCPATPILQSNMDWASLMASEEGKRHFMQGWQLDRQIALTDEDRLGDMIAARQNQGRLTMAEMDEVAGEFGSTATASLGSGPCILGFAHASLRLGNLFYHAVVSTHRSLDSSEALTPDEAYLNIIHPLNQRIAEQIPKGAHLHRISYRFAGGNPETYDSCVALAFEAHRRNLDVPVSMLGVNDANSYFNAMMTVPNDNQSSANFYLARVSESSSESSEQS